MIPYAIVGIFLFLLNVYAIRKVFLEASIVRKEALKDWQKEQLNKLRTLKDRLTHYDSFERRLNHRSTTDEASDVQGAIPERSSGTERVSLDTLNAIRDVEDWLEGADVLESSKELWAVTIAFLVFLV